MNLLFFVLLTLYALSSVHAYPDGAIAPVCDSMIPTHPNFVPQITTAPYRITVDRRTCRPGDMIRVTLESVNSTDFEGFMLQARPTSGNSAVGCFMPGNNSLVRLHNCFNTEVAYREEHNYRSMDNTNQPVTFMLQMSAISHSAANELTRIEVMWVAPLTSAPYNITFCATFVKNYAEFWTMVNSDTIQLSNSPAPAVSCLMPFCILVALGLCRS